MFMLPTRGTCASVLNFVPWPRSLCNKLILKNIAQRALHKQPLFTLLEINALRMRMYICTDTRAWTSTHFLFSQSFESILRFLDHRRKFQALGRSIHMDMTGYRTGLFSSCLLTSVGSALITCLVIPSARPSGLGKRTEDIRPRLKPAPKIIHDGRGPSPGR